MRKSTDWNWGLNDKSREARRVWPDLGVYAIVSPGAAAGTWYWRIYPQIPGHGPVRGGTARSSDAAKRGASEMVRDLIAPARSNPAPSKDSGWVVVDAAGRRERLAWPDRCIEAIVSPSFSSRHNWDWEVRGFGYGPTRGGHARSRSEAKRAAVEMMDELVTAARRNPSGSDKVRVLGIYPSGEVKELRVTAESLTWRKGKRKRDDRLSGPFLRKFGSYPVATIAMWGSDPDFHDETKVREMLSRYLRDSGRDERRNPTSRRSRNGVSKEWRWA